MRAMLPSWFPAAMSRRIRMPRGLARNSRARWGTRSSSVPRSSRCLPRAGVRVADLDRPVAQESVVAVREEGQSVPGVEAGGAVQALLVPGRDLESCRAEGSAHLLVPAELVRLGLIRPRVGRVSERDAVLRVDHWPLPRFPHLPAARLRPTVPCPVLLALLPTSGLPPTWPPRRRFPGTAGRVDQRLPRRLPSRQGSGLRPVPCSCEGSRVSGYAKEGQS